MGEEADADWDAGLIEWGRADAEPPSQFKEGDMVRDRARLGGQVIETWGNGVKVAWRNGYTTWIDARFLSLEASKA